MKRLMTFAAAGTAALLNAETLTVEKGQSVSVTSAVTYDAVTVHGDLTVSGAWLAIPDGTGVNGEEKVVVSLGPDAGDAATLTVKDDGEFGQTSNVGKGEILEVGANGGWGRVDVQSKKKTFAFRLRYFDIADAATPPAEDPTVLTVGGTVNLRSLRNKSSKAVKVTFAGGAVWAKDSNGYIWFENTQDAGTVILESGKDSPIRLDNNGQPYRVLSNGGTVRTTGDGDFVAAGKVSTRLVLSAANVQWGHAGDFVLQENIEVSCDGALPVGADTGTVKFDAVTGTTPLTLNLNGCVNAVNGVADLRGDSVITNASASVLSILRLGTAKDGAFSARAGGRLRIEQLGQEIALSNAVVDCAYVLSNGTLRVTGDSSVATLDVGKGTTVIVDGVTLTLGTLRDSGATFTCLNGGRLAFVKTGADTLFLNQATAISYDFHVAEGTLRLSGVGCTNEWWRWTVKETQGKYVVNVAAIGLFAATDDPSKWIPVTTKAIQPAPAGTAATDLAVNQSYVPETVALKDDGGDTASEGSHPLGSRFLFGNGFNQYLQTETLKPDGTSGTELPVTFRIASNAIVGFSQRASWGGAKTWPSVFSLETSANGTDWTTVLEMDDCRWTGGAAWYLGTTERATRDYCPNPLSIAGYDAPGAAGLAAGVDVRVDAGATLDLANVTEEAARTVSSLTVDMSKGGGTIRGLAVAEKGTLTLTNVASKNALKTAAVLTLPDVVGAKNFANWTLVLNGKVSPKRIAYEDGVVRIIPTGILVLIR